MPAMTSFFTQLVKYLSLDIFGSLITFPVWWYEKGFIEMATLAVRELRYRVKSYSFALWIKNLFVPMYGQYDLAGRAVSVFMRIVVLIGRGLALGAEALAYSLLLTLWLVVPLLAIFGIVWNLIS